MKQSILLIFCLGFLISCKTNQKGLSSSEPFFGEKFTTSTSMSYDNMLKEMGEEKELKDIVVEGNVSGVCQAMGCWMTMVSTQNTDSPEMFIKFQDYGFFVPKDLAGGKVIMKGNAFREETSVDELRHYAEDEGQSKEEIAAITEPVVELKFMASGVQIIK